MDYVFEGYGCTFRWQSYRDAPPDRVEIETGPGDCGPPDRVRVNIGDLMAFVRHLEDMDKDAGSWDIPAGESGSVPEPALAATPSAASPAAIIREQIAKLRRIQDSILVNSDERRTSIPVAIGELAERLHRVEQQALKCTLPNYCLP